MNILNDFIRIIWKQRTASSLMLLLLSIPSIAPAAAFYYDNGALVMTGEVDGRTPNALVRALNNHPDAQWIVFENVPGSSDDDANLQTGRIIFESGLNTLVPSSGLIASGGTDLFLAGEDRIIERGACVGVHSWAADDFSARDIAQSSSEHDSYLDYYYDIEIDQSFYWFTIEAASADDMHWMTATEVERYGVSTRSAPSLATKGPCENR